jgi:hypothetical protein
MRAWSRIQPTPTRPIQRKNRVVAAGSQFSLRTLMIGVTLLAGACGYVGWQAKIVHARRAELNRTVDARLVGIADNDEERVIPWIRHVLGDQRVGSIKMLVGTDVAVLDRPRDLFPEAKVEVWTPAEAIRRRDTGQRR